MYEIFLTLRSVTVAQRARDVCNRVGIRCVMQRSPRALATNGCAYALRLRLADGRGYPSRAYTRKSRAGSLCHGRADLSGQRRNHAAQAA